jgi:glycosyltransferase involved in cell wall biosynthesis
MMPSVEPVEPAVADMRPQWSVVVITRNEERHVAACLDGVCRAMRGRSHEIIVVDSNSSDRTVEIASRYPARVVRLGNRTPVTPAAGRHVGSSLARGELILFVDGDSILDAEWIAPALRAFDDERVAGVAGIREAVQHAAVDGSVRRFPFPQDVACGADLPFLGGSAAYRAVALRRVRGFNPFLYACEEAELGGRLCAAGYRLRRLPIRMTEHLTGARVETLRELQRRMRRGYPYGIGQLVRHGLANGTLRREHVVAVVRPIAALLVLTGGLMGVAVWLISGRSGLFLTWLLAVFVAWVMFAVRARSIRKPCYYAVEWAVTGWMILRGFSFRPRPANDYALPAGANVDTANAA